MMNNNNLFACVIITLIIFAAIIMSGCSAHTHTHPDKYALAEMGGEYDAVRGGGFAIKDRVVLRNDFAPGSYYDKQLYFLVDKFHNEIVERDGVVIVCRDCDDYHYTVSYNPYDESCTAHINFTTGLLSVVGGFEDTEGGRVVMCMPELEAAVLAHELMHALGFPHTREEGCLMTYPHIKGKPRLCDMEYDMLRRIYNPKESS